MSGNYSCNDRRERLIIDVLKRLDGKARKSGITLDEFNVKRIAIKNILDIAEDDFNTDFMVQVYIKACKEVGYIINPLDDSIMRKFIGRGFTIKDINEAVFYNK